MCVDETKPLTPSETIHTWLMQMSDATGWDTAVAFAVHLLSQPETAATPGRSSQRPSGGDISSARKKEKQQYMPASTRWQYVTVLSEWGSGNDRGNSHPLDVALKEPCPLEKHSDEAFQRMWTLFLLMLCHDGSEWQRWWKVPAPLQLFRNWNDGCCTLNTTFNSISGFCFMANIFIILKHSLGAIMSDQQSHNDCVHAYDPYHQSDSYVVV